MWYLGVDYHLEIAVVCVMTPTGKVSSKFEVPATPEGMDEMIDRVKDKRFRVLGEAFTYSMDLHNYLLSKGVISDLIQPDELQIITKSYKKTDYNDCEAIAWYLRLYDKGELNIRMSYIVKDDEMRLRDMARLMNSLSMDKAKVNQQIQAHMRRNGEYLPKDIKDSGISSNDVQKYIIETFGHDFTLQQYLQLYVILTERCKIVDAELKKFNVDGRIKSLLISIPGIGEQTAIMLMSMIIDITRFQSADKMRAYFGMNPVVRNSGETVKHGKITKKGDSMMRRILERSVLVHIRICPDSTVARMFNDVSSRSKKPVALLAAANKLLDIVYSVWSSGIPFHR